MGIFSEALTEVKSSMLKVSLFGKTLNAILIFLAIYLVFSLLKLDKFRIIIPLIIAIGYLGIAIYRETRIRPAKAVETKYKELREKLSTAAEYATVENRVVNELKSEVLRNLKKVEESSFMDERKVYIKSVAAIVLCFIILLTSPISVGFFKASFPSLFTGGGDPADGFSGKFTVGKEKARSDLPVGVPNPKTDIYGAPTVAKLGSEELKVILKPAGTELNTKNTKPPEDLQFTEQYPEAAAVPVAAESMEERIPKEQQELVRQYFKNVVASGN